MCSDVLDQPWVILFHAVQLRPVLEFFALRRLQVFSLTNTLRRVERKGELGQDLAPKSSHCYFADNQWLQSSSCKMLAVNYPMIFSSGNDRKKTEKLPHSVRMTRGEEVKT